MRVIKRAVGPHNMNPREKRVSSIGIRVAAVFGVAFVFGVIAYALLTQQVGTPW